MSKKNIIFTLLIILPITTLFGQTELYVLAKNGLNIREDADSKSSKKGKFNFTEKVEVLKETKKYFEINDQGKIVRGEWVQVKGKSDAGEIITGYVFSGFLSQPIQKDTFEFVNYNDNYDYFYLTARKEKINYQFINNEDGRSYLKGDFIEIEWKEKFISLAGDEESKELADWIVSTKKIKNGEVANFRQNYNQEIIYHNTTTYSQSFLDDLYLIVEHYLVNSQNELIKNVIDEKTPLEYSIEERSRNQINYVVFGINRSSENSTSTLQWLYYNNETGKLYEHNPSDDTLIEFFEK